MNQRMRKSSSAKNGSGAQAIVEQRREPRRPAHGAVQIRRAQAPEEIVGRLVDVSAHGFRAAHSCTTLHSGEIVEFSHRHNEGKARVMWTRVVSAGAPGVESGFMVLAEV
jgi:hypothetical protein